MYFVKSLNGILNFLILYWIYRVRANINAIYVIDNESLLENHEFFDFKLVAIIYNNLI